MFRLFHIALPHLNFDQTAVTVCSVQTAVTMYSFQTAVTVFSVQTAVTV
jgi:hypothetical protein